MSRSIFIGLMSGTSIDGVDATLVELESVNTINVLATRFTPYSNKLKQRINALVQHNGQLNTQEVATLDQTLAELYAECSLALIKQHKIDNNQVTAIANHGQTIHHAPHANPPYSIQLGNSQTIANHTNITTIGQFRQADLACGGQGAPLMPAFHQAVLKIKKNSAIINIGGIANITILGKPTIGFDTGPGNTLMDQWVLQHRGMSYDKNGIWAQQGNVINDVLDTLLDDPYFIKPAPKSTGPDYFNLAWLSNKISNLSTYSSTDIQATLLALTVTSIAQEIERTKSTTNNIYICGGGAHNTRLIEGLKKRLPKHTIGLTDDLGVPADWVESVGFAWLGYCCYHNIKSNLPAVTGARQSVVLGEITQPQLNKY